MSQLGYGAFDCDTHIYEPRDAFTRYLQFHGDAVPPRGSTILVRYTVDPGYVAPEI